MSFLCSFTIHPLKEAPRHLTRGKALRKEKDGRSSGAIFQCRSRGHEVGEDLGEMRWNPPLGAGRRVCPSVSQADVSRPNVTDDEAKGRKGVEAELCYKLMNLFMGGCLTVTYART